MEKSKSGIRTNLCSKKPLKKVTETHFQKVLKRQKSANSTKKCSNDNLKSAQTTIFIKRCILTEKVFVIFWALNGIYYLWRRQR